MKIVLGIDVGGSTTKIVAFDENKRIIHSLQVKSNDQITSAFGAVGNILYKAKLSLADICAIVITGVGASQIEGDIYDIPTYKVTEFEAIAHGGMILSGLDNILVVSMGTGTAFVEASQKRIKHIGGSGVGGGTLLGLSSLLFNQNSIDAIVELSEKGDLSKVDLTISDITKIKIPSLPDNATAANFGKVSSTVKNSDIAKGLMNMVYQTAGMMASFACRNTDIKNVVITGSVASLPDATDVFHGVGNLCGLNFVIPKDAMFATAIGAAQLYYIKIQGNN